MRFRRLFFISIILFFCIGIQTVSSAPEPSEIKEMKIKSPVHLKAVVLSDELFQDLTKEKENFYQIRKMKLDVMNFIKNTTNEPNELDVYYTYIPSWQADQWVGGKRVDIAVNDVIEIWLENGEYGLEPTLGGYTVEHIKYALEREEPIQEPTLHLWNRKIDGYWTRHSSLIVFGVLLLILIILFIIPRVKKSKDVK